jgi:hypothetical protein
MNIIIDEMRGGLRVMEWNRGNWRCGRENIIRI